MKSITGRLFLFALTISAGLSALGAVPLRSACFPSSYLPLNNVLYMASESPDASASNDPFVGRYRSGVGNIVVISANGTITVSSPGGSEKGTWKYISSPGESVQIYLINMSGGRLVFKMRLEEDHNKALGEDNKRTWTRVQDQ